MKLLKLIALENTEDLRLWQFLSQALTILQRQTIPLALSLTANDNQI